VCVCVCAAGVFVLQHGGVRCRRVPALHGVETQLGRSLLLVDDVIARRRDVIGHRRLADLLSRITACRSIHETFRVSRLLMSERTIRIPCEGRWRLRRGDDGEFMSALDRCVNIDLPSVNCVQLCCCIISKFIDILK